MEMWTVHTYIKVEVDVWYISTLGRNVFSWLYEIEMLIQICTRMHVQPVAAVDWTLPLYSLILG